MSKQLWTIRINYDKFDPHKEDDWSKIKDLKNYSSGDIISKFDDGNTGDVLLTVANKDLAEEISKLFNGADVMPSVIVDSKNLHMLHYSQYLITDMRLN